MSSRWGLGAGGSGQLPRALNPEPGANRGFTLLEVLVGSVIFTVMVGGMALAFATAMQLVNKAPRDTEALLLAHQTIERYRNKVACRQPGETPADTWFTGACAPDAPAGWTSDPVPAGAASTVGGQNPLRQYQVTPTDIDRDGQTDYVVVKVTMRWTPPQ